MTASMLVAGIDIGSTYTKAVLLDESRSVSATAVRRTGYKPSVAASMVFDDLVANASVTREQVNYIAATGYGRYMVPFRHTQITELTCHAIATSHHFPAVRTILDIGGQDIKAIRIDGLGRVRAFRLNDKCAAGTGAFLEKTARYLGLETADIGTYALRSGQPVEISSVCAVFAESEVINHLASGVAPEDIVEGAIEALGGRAIQLMKRVGLEPDFALAGGMTHNAAMVAALERKLGASLGLRRAEWLIAEGRAIAPPRGESETKARRWSTFVPPTTATNVSA
jgi:(R)-2-hydroxyacyl-CoA dehydratese activating ATPase